MHLRRASTTSTRRSSDSLTLVGSRRSFASQHLRRASTNLFRPSPLSHQSTPPPTASIVPPASSSSFLTFLRRLLFPASQADMEVGEPCLVIGEPREFEHRVHVGWDAGSGGFTGLPQEWSDAMETEHHAGLRIGSPTEFSHNVHVGWDQESGGYTGLPREWEEALKEMERL